MQSQPEKLPLFLRPGCGAAANSAVCVLAGAMLGFFLSVTYVHYYLWHAEPEIRVSQIWVDGPGGTSISLGSNGLAMYGKDYSIATLRFVNDEGKPPPVLEIRDKEGNIVFRSTPE